jgi:predicted metalloprotease
MGIGTLVILLVLSLVFKRDFFSLVGAGGVETAPETAAGPPAETTPEEERLVSFVSFVLDDAQNVWRQKLSGYQDAKLVLFTDAVQSGCGTGEAAMGPFYCPLDEKVYIDLGFYGQLERRFGAPGDFAQAYVIAHEIGHHVQHLMGLDTRMRQQQKANPREANELSIAHELQADCFAGVWGHSTNNRGLLEAGDIEEGLGAASAVGDDRIQKQGRGRVNPETWTHGSAEQRSRWFKRGLQSGDPKDCDTSRGG